MKRMTKLYPLNKAIPYDYEKWLEDFESAGWHLENISLAGFLHHYVQGEPHKYKYIYDFQEKKKLDYETIFMDAGWELVYYCMGTYIWRMDYTEVCPEAFTDPDSIIARNKRMICVLIAVFAAYPAFLPTMINNLDLKAPLSILFPAIYTGLTFFGVYCIISLIFANKKLKNFISK